ncbi:MAG: S-methyl-5-thioribose-1-phosphate isomerase [Candidatus Omnitrophica bacterium]|nr:S-methyl-5-thioribose-1-phosphate isomerase [Candidatus Omnitrophota bacterium]
MDSIRFKNDRLWYLDQTQLPLKEKWYVADTVDEVYEAIVRLKIRGAPLIGVFCAYGVYIAMKKTASNCRRKDVFLKQTYKIIDHLKTSRPTAVNLFWALDRIKNAVAQNGHRTIGEITRAVLNEAKTIHAQDRQLCARIGEYGMRVIRRGDSILTHCNAGCLATAGEGTALSVIFAAARIYGKKNIHVFVDETRPLLQGARLTAWELTKKQIPATLITDNMAGFLMQQGKIDKIVVGADRIAANGDVANKIGTYSVAVLARHHRIPFYVAAPFSTFDLKKKTGKRIPIEQRNSQEVTMILGKLPIAPKTVPAYNPAFDVTPHELITAIITDRGIIKPPYKQNIKKRFDKVT